MWKAKITGGLDGLAEITERELQRAITRGVNTAAFEARKAVPKIVADQIDKPSARLRILQVTRVDKAATGGKTAEIHIWGRQWDILSAHEYGRNVPFLTSPLRSGADQYGNTKRILRDKSRREAATILDRRQAEGRRRKTTGADGKVSKAPRRKVGKYFRVKMTDRSRLAPGTYERMFGNKSIRIVASTRRSVKLRPTFEIVDGIGEAAAPLVMKYIQESIDFRIKKKTGYLPLSSFFES